MKCGVLFVALWLCFWALGYAGERSCVDDYKCGKFMAVEIPSYMKSRTPKAEDWQVCSCRCINVSSVSQSHFLQLDRVDRINYDDEADGLWQNGFFLSFFFLWLYSNCRGRYSTLLSLSCHLRLVSS